MNVHVDEGRFLSVGLDPDERIVFDRKAGKYHLLRESAARLWEHIGEGGSFELESPEEDEDDPVALLEEAGLIEVVGQHVRQHVL